MSMLSAGIDSLRCNVVQHPVRRTFMQSLSALLGHGGVFGPLGKPPGKDILCENRLHLDSTISSMVRRKALADFVFLFTFRTGHLAEIM